MFINDVNKKEEIRNIAIRHLRKHGIKYRDKNSRQFVQVAKSKKFFKIPLQNLENETVTLKDGQQLVIPKRLYEMCCFICRNVEVEGIFRKEGSKSRQNEIKLLLDRGCLLGDDHHVIDVAVVLKRFLRELPEPLIPFSYHELFLRCCLVDKKVDTLLLACLLLPSEHLNVLSFLMQFLNEVANHSKYNKMDSYNIAILVGPNIFPINEKVAPKNKLMITKICDIIKLLIEHSRNIGLIPDYIIEQIGSLAPTEVDVNRIKRRRSGSLTRIFNGLKKIVGNRPEEEMLCKTVTPDLLLTPSITSSGKCEEENHRKKQKLKGDEDVQKKGGSKTVLERRWSAITHATNFKRKKRNSSVDLPQRGTGKISKENNDKDISKADYVQVSKKEYEEIKNRVSAIEKRLYFEFENVQSTIICDNADKELNIIQNIQSAYEQTLVQTEPLSPGTDQIARRLSRELRIRNSEQKMIRSPSARKIGNMRRRSRELDKPNNKLMKNPSFHFADMKQAKSKLIRDISSITKTNSKVNVKDDFINIAVEDKDKQTILFHDRYKSTRISCSSSTRIPFNSSDDSPEMQTCDKSIFSNLDMVCGNDIAFSSKLNKQNVEIFQNNAISLESNTNDVTYVNIITADNLTTNICPTETERKVHCDTKAPHEIKTLQTTGKTNKKQGTFTVRKKTEFKQKGKNNEKLYMEMKHLDRNNKENGFVLQEYVLNRPAKPLDNYTPKSVPHIKKPIIVKSPKRICNTSQNHYRNTPMKVLTASNCYSPNGY